MIRIIQATLALAAVTACCGLLGCDSSPPTSSVGATASNPSLTAPVPGQTTGSADGLPTVNQTLLEGIFKLIENAAMNPNGANFSIATENLNNLFQDTPPDQFALDPNVRAMLTAEELPPGTLESIERTRFVDRIDGRHIEDTMLCRRLAKRIAGDGDELTQVTRIFDWVVRQTELVPNGSLAPPGFAQAESRPYDVLLRAMATEEAGGWCERGWLFLALCRQIDVDIGLITYPPRSHGLLPKGPTAVLPAPVEPFYWLFGALIGGKVYLFDPAIGLPIPRADGTGVATLDEATSDPSVLAQLDLPGTSNYVTQYPEIAKARFRVLIDSGIDSLSPRMRLFQKVLTGNYRMKLYRDPIEQQAAWKAALGDRCDGVSFWQLPMRVQYRLFNDAAFNRATQFPLQLFEARWPLLPARLAHLRGDLDSAIQSYVAFRYADRALENDGKTPIARPVQEILDLYATYYLALAQLDRGDTERAAFLFKETLRLLPEPGRNKPMWYMFRWGAQSNLGRIAEAQGDFLGAVRYYSAPDPTPQTHGNRLRARTLIWRDPFAPIAKSAPAASANEEKRP